MIISNDILEKTCKDMIETILFCLSDATKGTIYRIGKMPNLQAVRITSGIRREASDEIDWGLPEVSDYNAPGKSWIEYRDRPGHVLEAMGWCVERQKSWTADDPYEDIRSVRKQLSGEIEDFHHMEPVLVPKRYLYGDQLGTLVYPLDCAGRPIWQDSEYVVAAVVKIHFKPYAIHRGDRSTKLIKKLSRTLGTELLSLHIRETLAEAQKDLTRQRLRSCNVLAHDLRNTLVKLGFICTAINTEFGYLREQWEDQVEKALPEPGTRKALLDRLTRLLESRLPSLNGAEDLLRLGRTLVREQKELAHLSPMPAAGLKWLEHQIRPKWMRLLSESDAWSADREEILEVLERYQHSSWLGMSEELLEKMQHLPEEIRREWPRLAYVDFTADKLRTLNDAIRFLDHPQLSIPHKHQTRKILASLRAIVEMIPEIEERSNRIISSLRNGGASDIDPCTP
ncbi:MAG TPA: hypothetical protein PLM79_09185 [Syntrophobacteraceae bacterium]|nr:hypothetical protein [Syntrophobacteraceae bacterium]